MLRKWVTSKAAHFGKWFSSKLLILNETILIKGIRSEHFSEVIDFKVAIPRNDVLLEVPPFLRDRDSKYSDYNNEIFIKSYFYCSFLFEGDTQFFHSQIFFFSDFLKVIGKVF